MNDYSEKVFSVMTAKGYPAEFAQLIAGQMNTEYTSQRMIKYIGRAGLMPPEEIADEMLSILSERDRLIKKHIAEHAQKKINEVYNREDPA